MKTQLYKTNKGMTLVEVMFTVAISTMVLCTVVSSSMYFSKSFVTVSNYTDMNQNNRNVIDTMGKRIRQTKSLISFSPTKLTFKDIDSNTLTYSYDALNKQIVQMDSKGTNVLLRGCDSLNFQIFQRNPSNQFTFYPATTNTAKIVSITWKTSRDICGEKINTEDIQTAKVVIRN